MSSIDDIRAKYRETLAAAESALAVATRREETRLAVRAADLALDQAKEAKRLAEASDKIGKLRAKVEDYTTRLKATGVSI